MSKPNPWFGDLLDAQTKSRLFVRFVNLENLDVHSNSFWYNYFLKQLVNTRQKQNLEIIQVEIKGKFQGYEIMGEGRGKLSKIIVSPKI